MFEKTLEKILCGLKLHNWVYTYSERLKIKRRYCSRCNLWQDAVYDMAYGGTYYVDSIGTFEIYPFEKFAEAQAKNES